jgi:hypothetical protein
MPVASSLPGNDTPSNPIKRDLSKSSQATISCAAAAVVSLSIILAGCAALPTPVVFDYGASHSVEGMSALLRAEVPSQPLHVLLVHGMGTPTPNGFGPFIARSRAGSGSCKFRSRIEVHVVGGDQGGEAARLDERGQCRKRVVCGLRIGIAVR